MKKLRRSSLLLLAFLFSGVSRADSYTVLTIDVPGAAGTVPHAINNLGQIVGTYTDASSEYGFLYRGGTFTTIDVPGATATQALGINDTGRIVGTYTDAGGEHGFLYLDGTFTTTDVPDRIASEAINDAGQMVGSYIDARGAMHGFFATPVSQPGPTDSASTPTAATYARASHAISARTASAGVCDVNGSGATNVADVQLMINEALGKSPAANDLNFDGVVNITDVQVVINAALGLGCTPLSSSTGTSAVANLEVLSGNGQGACLCYGATLQQFQPIYVKATDAGGNPVVGATVTWTVTSGQMLLTSSTSVTGVGGVASQSMNIGGFVNIAGPNPDLVSTIQASSNGSTVIFTETQSLVANGTSAIKAASPNFNGANLGSVTLSAGIGTTLTTPIEVMMGGYGIASDGVANISVRLLNEQAAPAVNCVSGGGYADPGSVLSDIHGNTDCYPTFSGSGSGMFYVLIGGLPGTDISTAFYLQEYGPYTFTSVPGPPAAVQIVSGNKQVGNIGQTLNPLVARLVDANGNVETGQTMVWSVVPAGSVGLTNGSAVTDSNGEVSTTVSLDLLASAGASITVALQSNPSISATFQETIYNALTALNKVSGDQQTAPAGTSFAQPLVVQLLNASGPVSGFPVRYLVNGPVSLPGGTAADTDANGEASVTVIAGAQGGTATVTAVAGALTQTFTLTVH
jgi:probable HAF family extracellular repeat protein